jgi:hypothetical protein
MRRMMTLFMALSAMLSCQVSLGQIYITTEADKSKAGEVMKVLSKACEDASVTERNLSVSELMVIAAKEMLGTPYVAGTLEEDPLKEQLRIYLTKTDCILFVETCLNLARTVKDGSTAFDDFATRTALSRYRCKPPYTYGDRIHYTTEWIRRQKDVLKDITMELGGEVNDHPIHFMSSNPKSYKQLADASNIPRAALDLRKIEKVEAALNKEPMTFIPKAKVATAVRGIKTGDIICYVSNVRGLDIAHVAIALVEGDRVGFIHASQVDGKVEIDKQTIAEYVGSRSHLSGIKVVRPL